MFSPTADFIVAFNGGVQQSGGDKIEVMAYNLITERYDFHEFQFEKLKVNHEKNPSKCKACHTEASVPNWRGYQDWRGAYGAQGNAFERVSVDPAPGAPKNPRPTDSDRYRSGATDLVAFKKFIEQQSQHARYKSLVQPKGEDAWPFKLDKHSDAFDFSPNRRFGIGLIFHHGRSLASALSKTELYKNYPAHITYNLLKCTKDGSENKTFINDVKATFLRDSMLSAFCSKDQGNPCTHDFLTHLSISGILGEAWGTSPDKGYSPIVANWIETGLFEMNQVSMVTGTFLYDKFSKASAWHVPADGPTESMSVRMGVPQKLLQKLHQISPLYAKESINTRVCQSLASSMIEENLRHSVIQSEVTEPIKQRLLNALNTGPYILQKCIQCHTDQHFKDAPYIPFHNKELLRQALKAPSMFAVEKTFLEEIKNRTLQNAADSYRMPKGPFGMNTEAHVELVHFLENL